jgi:hypothetical protein
MPKQNQFSMTWLVVVCFFLAGPGYAQSEDGGSSAESVGDLLGTDSELDALFVLVLPEGVVNEGQLSIRMPQLAESLLPAILDATNDAKTGCRTDWLINGKLHHVSATWQRAGRGLESRFSVSELPDSIKIPSSALLMMGQVFSEDEDSSPEFRCRILRPGERREWALLCRYFGIVESDVRPGVFGIYSPWSVRGHPVRSVALEGFLGPFDRISSRGFVSTQRSGSTGIGYTFESLLEISENNSPVGDFLGMELKAHRRTAAAASGSKRMNLFLKEPTWTDGLAHRERIPKYGYVDDNGRVALYSTVTSAENSHGLRLSIDDEERKIELNYRGKSVAFWTFDILQGRLKEKLSETAFVGAESRGTGRDEEFHYDSVLFCQEPSVESLVALIRSRESMVEMRMHIREDGSARNHGTAFRVHQDQLPRLFTRTVQIRAR